MTRTFYLTKEFYDNNAIKTSIIAYKDIAAFSVKDNENCYEICINSSFPDLERIENEFKNYVLAQMNL